MDREQIIREFKWFCEDVGGEFSEEEMGAVDEFKCRGNIDGFYIESNLHGDGRKVARIIGGGHEVDISIDADEQLEVETAYRKVSISEAASFYRKSGRKYDLQYSRIIVNEMNGVALRFFEDGLNIFVW